MLLPCKQEEDTYFKKIQNRRPIFWASSSVRKAQKSCIICLQNLTASNLGSSSKIRELGGKVYQLQVDTCRSNVSYGHKFMTILIGLRRSQQWDHFGQSAMCIKHNTANI